MITSWKIKVKGIKMSHKKILFSALLAAILLATQIMAVGAAPITQETTPITGTVVSITLETDSETDVTTVVVVFMDEFEETQTVRLSLEYAIFLELVTDDGTGPVVDDSKIGSTVEIDPDSIIPETADETEEQHPVGKALSEFFYELLGVEYETVMDYHDEGVGFGVIAQALWMTNALEGDTETFAAILEAKMNKDYSGFTLPDDSTPQNWGQFRKAVMSDQEGAKKNLGYIMSGRADEDQENGELNQPKNNGNAPDKETGQDKDKEKGNSKEKSNNGKNEDKGKDKNKNKDK